MGGWLDILLDWEGGEGSLGKGYRELRIVFVFKCLLGEGSVLCWMLWRDRSVIVNLVVCFNL